MANKALAQGDKHLCPLVSNVPHAAGQIFSNCSTSVFINDTPLATVGSKIQCKDGSFTSIISGSSKVFVEGQALATDGSKTDHNGQLIASNSILELS